MVKQIVVGCAVARRRFIAGVAAAIAAPGSVLAQTPARVYRIALLDEVSAAAFKDTWGAFHEHLRELGYVEGKNVVFEARHGEETPERLPVLAAELAALKPDLIACLGTPSTRAAVRAAPKTPVVFLSAGDPVAAGLVASLSRPGRNATGISSMTTETGRKSLEMLLEIAPGARKIAYLADPENQISAAIYMRVEEQARRLKRSIQMLDGSTRSALDQAFETIRREHSDALLVGSSGTVVEYRDEIINFAAREKLPAVYGRLEFAPGGLLTYGIDRIAAARRAADLVHRILHGAKPGDLAVEQSGLVRLVLNMKAAQALGIRIPESIRLRADMVIQ